MRCEVRVGLRCGQRSKERKIRRICSGHVGWGLSISSPAFVSGHRQRRQHHQLSLSFCIIAACQCVVCRVPSTVQFTTEYLNLYTFGHTPQPRHH